MAKVGRNNHWERLKQQLADANARIAELEAVNAKIPQSEDGTWADQPIMRLPIDPLPKDSKCFVITRVDARLHGEGARKFTAILHHLQRTHATVAAPAYASGRVHVDKPTQALQWLLEQTELVGSGGAGEWARGRETEPALR